MQGARRTTTSHFRAAAGGGRRGYSLFELVVVLALVALVAALAVPRYVSSVARYRAEAAARRIVADLALARAKAKAASATQVVTFNPATGSYSVTGVRDLDLKAGVYTVSLSRSPYNVSIDYADFGGVPQAKFNMYGSAPFGGKVVVRAGDYACTVALNADDGLAKVQ